MNKFMVGQRVILTGQGGIQEIGTVVVNPTGHRKNSVRVFSPTRKYDSEYDICNVNPLPNGQL